MNHISDELPEIERSIEVDATPAEIWQRVVDGALSQEWLGLELEPRRGGKVIAIDREMIGTVEDVEPGRSITWSWRTPDSDPSQVTITIDPLDHGTRVTVTERLLDYRIDGTGPIFLAAA